MFDLNTIAVSCPDVVSLVELLSGDGCGSPNYVQFSLFSFLLIDLFIPYPTAFPYGNGMVLHFYQQQESSTIKTVHKVINKRLKTYA